MESNIRTMDEEMKDSPYYQAYRDDLDESVAAGFISAKEAELKRNTLVKKYSIYNKNIPIVYDYIETVDFEPF